MTAKPIGVFLGSGSMLRSCVAAAEQSGQMDVGLVAMRKDPRGRHGFIRSFCERLNIPVLVYETKRALAERIDERRPDILISIYNQDILGADILRPGMISLNFHEAPLPKYAGVNSPAWALLHGESRYGVTWHALSPKIDAGDIVLQSEFDIDPSWSILDLEMKCIEYGSSSFRELLNSLLDGKMSFRPQDLRQRSYFAATLKPFGGKFPFLLEAEYLQRLRRATSYFPAANPFWVPKITVNDAEFGLVRFAIVSASGDAVPGTILQIGGEEVLFALPAGTLKADIVQELDGKQTSAGEFARSRNFSVGQRAHIDESEAFTKEGLPMVSRDSGNR